MKDALGSRDAGPGAAMLKDQTSKEKPKRRPLGGGKFRESCLKSQAVESFKG